MKPHELKHPQELDRRPYIINKDWALRHELEVLANKFVVVIAHFDGETITPLLGCTVPVAYKYQPHSPHSCSIAVRNSQDFDAHFMAQRLSSGRMKAHEFSLQVVGSYATARSRFDRSELVGGDACQHATHIVSMINVGAFRRRSEGESQSSWNRFKRSKKTINNFSEGHIDACQRSPTTYDPNCGSYLRLTMNPIVGETPPAETIAPTPEPERYDAPTSRFLPGRGLRIAGGLTLGVSALFGAMAGFGIARSGSREEQFNDICLVDPKPESCTQIEEDGKVADRLQIAGLVGTPVLLVTGVALLITARLKLVRRHALAPQLTPNTVGLTWAFNF